MLKPAAAFLWLLFAAACVPAVADQTVTPRAADVEVKSAAVMPFSLAQTTHVFTPAPDGGTQAVLVNDGNVRQIQFVRAHLNVNMTKM